MGKTTTVIIVCCVYFVVLIFAGTFSSVRNKKASDYLVASRKLNLLFIIATLSTVQIGIGIILGGSINGKSIGIYQADVFYPIRIKKSTLGIVSR